MNSDYENNSQGTTFLDSLIQANGQAMEVREQVPYQPVVYAIPEEWLNAEIGFKAKIPALPVLIFPGSRGKHEGCFSGHHDTAVSLGTDHIYARCQSLHPVDFPPRGSARVHCISSSLGSLMCPKLGRIFVVGF